MISTKILRVGQHVKVGSVYPTFAVPKHLAKIITVNDGSIECVSSNEQVYSDEYNEDEMEGIEITAEMLEKNSFKKSQLRNTRWFYVNEDTKARITIDLCDCTVSAMGTEHIQRTGIKYLHQLESIIADAEIDMSFLQI